jgi:hypothetical protein
VKKILSIYEKKEEEKQEKRKIREYQKWIKFKIII